MTPTRCIFCAPIHSRGAPSNQKEVGLLFLLQPVSLHFYAHRATPCIFSSKAFSLGKLSLGSWHQINRFLSSVPLLTLEETSNRSFQKIVEVLSRHVHLLDKKSYEELIRATRIFGQISVNKANNFENPTNDCLDSVYSYKLHNLKMKLKRNRSACQCPAQLVSYTYHHWAKSFITRTKYAFIRRAHISRQNTKLQL